MKRCSKCKVEKLEADFYKNKRKKDGLECSCKMCANAVREPRKHQYYEQHRAKVIQQTKDWRKNNKERKKFNDRKWKLKNSEKVVAYTMRFRKNNPTAQRASNLKKYGLTIEQYNELFVVQNGLCAICKTSGKIIRGRSLYVDHNHETKQVRGLLCHNCNFGIGNFKENIDSLLSAVKYLKQNE